MKYKILFLIFAVTLLVGESASAQLIYVPYNSTASTSVWSTTNTGTTSSTTGCITFSKDLMIGMRDTWTGDIVKLQTFLISKRYLAAGLSTGYFGSLTFSAVRSFQAANGIISTGYVGPLTRAKISALTCGTTTTPPVGINAPVLTSVTPQSGPFGTAVTIYGRNFSRTSNSINFAGVNNIVTNVPSYDGVSVQFTVPASPCPQGNNVCPMMALAPGQYPISVTTSGGTSNSVMFTAGNTNTTNTPPTLYGIDGPTTLNVSEQGTWTVRALDVTGGGLSYTVVWGDENQQYGGYYYTSSNTYVQSGSFTHVYKQAGTYKPTFTVKGSNGLTAQVSITVNVVGGTTTNPAPTITSLSPSFGPVGTTVTVSGSNFSLYNNSINFAGVNRAVVNVSSYDGKTLQFNVPGTPCSYGNYCAQVVIPNGTYPVSVSNTNGTSSSLNFTVGSGSTSTTTTSIDQTVTLALDQKAVFNNNGLDITPVSITEDSRCPSSVTCIQAGRVVVRTLVNSGSGQNYVNLTSGSDIYSTNGYTVRITNVTPAKVSTGNIPNNEYRITYRVTK